MPNNSQFQVGTFTDVAGTPLAKNIWEFLKNPSTLAILEAITYVHKPAIEGIIPSLKRQPWFPGRLSDREKMMAGAMVRQIMTELGYMIEKKGVPFRNKEIFSTSARYRKN
jgi:hypothetical protein